ncbi:hypothetical protein [Gemmobacter sp. 24YEA27]|uniref:hypothetical protein n=1 Tax=Gemmobacter sp. 24YEA27 TaxID=3040672 RepID=UPI0024B37545|nr:hypothetical protein [Gemmobacter sp. 24YEA27]
MTEEQARLNAGGRMGWDDLLAPDTPVFPVSGWHGDALSRSGYEGILRVIETRMGRIAAAQPG